MPYLSSNFTASVFLTLVLLLSSVSTAFGADVSLSWNRNNEPDVAGYKLYYGTSSRSYASSVNVGNLISYTLTVLNTGTYYFAVTAYDTSGNESGLSNEVSKSVASGSNPPPAPTGGTLLVDFGSSNGSDVFGVSGWSTLLRDIYTENRPLGPGGATIVLDNNWTYNFQGVSGTLRSFVANDKILVTWFNNSSSAVSFKPGISFTDPDRRDFPASQPGVWYDMSAVTIPASGTAQTEFLFTSSTAGSYSLVNVNNNFQNNQLLVCDRIELVPSGQVPPPSSPLPAPTNIRVK